jgi:hypothetical protein
LAQKDGQDIKERKRVFLFSMKFLGFRHSKQHNRRFILANALRWWGRGNRSTPPDFSRLLKISSPRMGKMILNVDNWNTHRQMRETARRRGEPDPFR